MLNDLQQKRILVTRNEPKASEFAAEIERRGGIPLIAPLIRIECTSLNLANLEAIESYEWIIFTSANGVRCFFKQVERQRVKGVKIAAVGVKTNESLRAYGHEADFIPSVYNAKTMAPEFIRDMQPKGKVLIVHGQLSGTILNEAFLQENIPFDCLEVYDTTANADVKSTLQQALQEIDWITFTSPSTVDACMTLVDDPEDFYNTPVFSIGTTTEKRALECGFKYVYVPGVFTIEGMLERMSEYIEERKHETDEKNKF